MAQLNNMARKGTVPIGLASAVQAIVQSMPSSAKLNGLGSLIANLKKVNPDRWRLVVFTTRLETQTTIQIFLEKHGLKVGIINGASGARNQETVVRFRKNPPACHVIVSTEAGSERPSGSCSIAANHRESGHARSRRGQPYGRSETG
jgi:ERCC4-related helicase